MAIIFLNTPAQVAEHSTGSIYLNVSLRLDEKGEKIFEVKTSCLTQDGIPAISIVQVEKLAQFSGREADAKKKCEQLESKIREEMEQAGYTVFQGTVSEGNTQRFSIMATEIIGDSGLKAKPKKKKEEKNPAS